MEMIKDVDIYPSGEELYLVINKDYLMDNSKERFIPSGDKIKDYYDYYIFSHKVYNKVLIIWNEEKFINSITDFLNWFTDQNSVDIIAFLHPIDIEGKNDYFEFDSYSLSSEKHNNEFLIDKDRNIYGRLSLHIFNYQNFSDWETSEFKYIDNKDFSFLNKYLLSPETDIDVTTFIRYNHYIMPDMSTQFIKTWDNYFGLYFPISNGYVMIPVRTQINIPLPYLLKYLMLTEKYRGICLYFYQVVLFTLRSDGNIYYCQYPNEYLKYEAIFDEPLNLDMSITEINDRLFFITNSESWSDYKYLSGKYFKDILEFNPGIDKYHRLYCPIEDKPYWIIEDEAYWREEDNIMEYYFIISLSFTYIHFDNISVIMTAQYYDENYSYLLDGLNFRHRENKKDYEEKRIAILYQIFRDIIG